MIDRKLYHDLANLMAIAEGHVRIAQNLLEKNDPESLLSTKTKLQKTLDALGRIMTRLKEERALLDTESKAG